MTCFLICGMLFPDAQVLLFGIIPVRMRILAWIEAGLMSFDIFSNLAMAVLPVSLLEKVTDYYVSLEGYSTAELMIMRHESITVMFTILISVLNFLIFFFVTAKKRAENKKRKREFQQHMEAGKKRQQYGSVNPNWWRNNANNANNAGNANNVNNAGNANNASNGGFGRPGFRAGAAAKNDAAAQKGKYGVGSAKELVHRCSICGRTNIEHPELMFRYCSKCAGNHEYCQDHLFTHEHVK